jgi:3,4-dihydroxy 2-butanone 4-phosphate synthase / GTP cyclohydrolase II
MSSAVTPFATIEEAVEDIRNGKMVVVVDDPERENEGDLVCAAQFATPEAVNFMATHARGLICLCLTGERCEQLGLPPMTQRNEARLGTAFTVSVEAREGVTTGISAADRAHTIQVAIDPASTPHDLVQPGHVFPLRARDGGVLVRAGQTEASVDLARLAGLVPAGVVCEIMNEDGTMARVPDLVPYCERHGLRMITVADLIEYRRRTEKLIERVVSVQLPTDYGLFTATAFRETLTGRDHLALVMGEVGDDVLVRVHSECLTGDVFHSLRCDCGRARCDRRRGSRRAAVHGAGGAWHRPPQQAQGIRAPGAGARHRRRQPRARLRGRRAGVGDRQPDPRRPRNHDDAAAHQQSEEGLRRRGVRPEGDRASADRDAAASRERSLSGRQAG